MKSSERLKVVKSVKKFVKMRGILYQMSSVKKCSRDFYRVFEVREIARDFSRDCSFGKNVNKVAIFEVSSAAFSTTRFDDRNDGMISSVHFIIPESRPQCREGLVFLRDGPRQYVKNVF